MVKIKSRTQQNIFALWSAAAFIAAFAMLIIYSGDTAAAVRNGITICVSSVIPSLFPMMFLSQYIVKSGAADIAGSLLNKPTHLLFGLPGVCGVAMMTAFVGGYPAGARAAETLVAEGKISRREGERLAETAFCAGPGFAIGMIGAALYKNKSVGLLILTAQGLSCIIIGIAYRFIFGGHDALYQKQHQTSPISHNPDAFVQSAADTAVTLLNMCSFIILFQIITGLLGSTGVNGALGNLTGHMGLGHIGQILLPCVAEVTGGSILSVSVGIPFTAFVAGFGGLSVHFQNFAICRTIRPNKTVYFITRIMQGGLCSLIASLALKLPCFSSAALPTSGMEISGIPADFSHVSTGFGCAMLVMCLMSVLCLPVKKEITRS